MSLNYKNPVALLKYVVCRLESTEHSYEYLTHNQITNIVFGIADDSNQFYVSKVLNHFPRYIKFENNHSQKYRFDIEKIYDEFPHFQNPELLNEKEDKISEMIEAIEHEIIASKQDRQKHTYKILSYKQLKVSNIKGIYELKLELEEDDYIKIYDGMPANIKISQYIYNVEIIEFDSKNSKLFIQAEYKFGELFSKYTCFVEIDAVWLLEAIKKRLQNFKKNANFPINKLFSGIKNPFKIKFDNTKLYTGKLDEFQMKAMVHALNNDITLIWGPPGTGKSYSLAYSLLNSLLKNEKTIVCCIANVAVDAITTKLIDILSVYTRERTIDYKNGRVLRIGITNNAEIVKANYLFPNSEKIRLLRQLIDNLNESLNNEIDENNKIGLKGKKTDAKKALDMEIKTTIENANIVFCTAAKVHSDTIFEDMFFDNLIVDEASMMSVPHFVAIAQNISKRIIISGDFKQLGPVVLSNSYMSQKWLHQDIFEFSGVDYKNNNMEHPALIQLLIQRRFNETICGLINKPFYKGRLQTEEGIEQTKLIPYIPAPGRAIAFYNLSLNREFKCISTKKGSRLNKFSAEFIVNTLLNQIQNHPILGTLKNIGIITPYRAQVNEINRLIAEKDWNPYFKMKLMVGTIHSYQGSEANLLIFDLVESKGMKVGRLYQFDTGERLVNVALTRVKSKLVIVGDIDAIIDNIGSNNIEESVVRTFINLKRYNFRF